MGQSIVELKNLADALRNTGYKSIDCAAAEIVDNSLEAEAKHVFVIIKDEVNDITGRKNISEIAFLDNGYGMDEATLGSCLGYGATTRAARKGMGRFGVGLPQASMYASPFVEVYSWTEGADCTCKKVFLDIRKVSDGVQTEIADPEDAKIPSEYEKYINYNTPMETCDFSTHGTLVVWKECDRVVPKTKAKLVELLKTSLGKKFRYYIHNQPGLIKVIEVDNSDKYINIMPNDPLQLMEDNCYLGLEEYPGVPYEYGEKEKLETFFETYVADGINDGIQIINIEYEKDGEILESPVTIKYSKVKNIFYDKTAFPGKDPGGSDMGKYLRTLEGISIVRANREIDFGRFDFYDNTNEPAHRFWGCEINFNPELDELFGVANNKQQVELRDSESTRDWDPIIDGVEPIWSQLKSVKDTINKIKKENSNTRAGSRSVADIISDAAKIVDIVDEDEDETNSLTETVKNEMEETELIEKNREELKVRGIEEPSEEDVKAFMKNKLSIVYESKGKADAFMEGDFSLAKIKITINMSHQFYTNFLGNVIQDNQAKVTFELFIASLYKSINRDPRNQDVYDWMLSSWNSKLNEYIHEQLHPTINPGN